MPEDRALPGGLLAAIGPGLLVAATGVGAGDLATAGFSGRELGFAVLWAIPVGAALKLALTEGITRWQAATGTTLLEGGPAATGRWFRPLMIAYFLPWMLFVGASLITASGVAAHAILPILPDAERGRDLWSIAHTGVAAALVYIGGFKLFERVMAVAIAVMFITVTVSAAATRPDPGALLRGLLIPSVPGGEGLAWTVALMGGVGGTVTVLCYGYWLREHGRDRPELLPAARIDLAVGHLATAIFGIAMVVIAAGLGASGNGVDLITDLGDRLGRLAGPWGRYAFLLGAWAAMVSSLLGVWQSAPMLFADLVRTRPRSPLRPPETEPVYRWTLAALAIVPCVGLFVSFRTVQRVYAVFGATFIPLLAVLLLLMNSRRHTGRLRNGPAMKAVLACALALFTLFAAFEIRDTLG